MNPLIALLYSLFQATRDVFMLFVPNSVRYKNIEDDVVLITGGGSGLGRALAVTFARHGVKKIVLWDINDGGMKETKSLVESPQFNCKCWIYVCDVSDRHKVYEMANYVKRDVGTVSMLVNNAGVVSGSNILDLKDEQIIRSFEINSLAHFWTIKAFLGEMIQQDRGHITSIASLAGLGGAPRLTDYCASKFAAVGLEESLRLELKTAGNRGVHSTVVCPFYIDTGMFKGVNTGLLNTLRPDDVAEIVVDGVRANREVIYIPRFFYFLVFLKTFFSSDANWTFANDVIQYTHSMDSFTGRNEKESKKSS